MSDTVIRIENLSKQYRLGKISGKTLRDDLTLWWARRRGKPNPLAKIDQPHLPTNGKAESIWALKDVSFEVKRGEVLGIIGRNGAGKSTLLKILSRVTSPTSGNVFVRGRIASLLEVGTGFHPELTGRENIYLNGAILGMTKAEIRSKFDEIVAFAEVEKFIDTPVKRYSSGMYVRLAFAVAAHLEPEILIVDEVLAVGDAEFQKKCLGKMGEVAKEGRTVCFVSHNMGAIDRLTRTSVLLESGEIKHFGKTEEVISHYLRLPTSQRKQFPVGDERFLLHEAKVTPERSISTSEEINVCLRFEIRRAIPDLRIGFDLLNSSGDRVFRSFHDDLDAIKKTIKPGIYTLHGRVPPNILKPGSYYISIEIGIHNVEMIITGNVIFPLELLLTNGVNHLYGGHKSTVIMPAIKWKMGAND